MIPLAVYSSTEQLRSSPHVTTQPPSTSLMATVASEENKNKKEIVKKIIIGVPRVGARASLVNRTLRDDWGRASVRSLLRLVPRLIRHNSFGLKRFLLVTEMFNERKIHVVSLIKAYWLRNW